MVEVLANVLAKNRFSAATVAAFADGQWHMAALVAKVPDPDPEVQAMVVRLLQAWEHPGPSSARHPSSNLQNRIFDSRLADYRHRLEESLKQSRR